MFQHQVSSSSRPWMPCEPNPRAHVGEKAGNVLETFMRRLIRDLATDGLQMALPCLVMHVCGLRCHKAAVEARWRTKWQCKVSLLGGKWFGSGISNRRGIQVM